MLNVKNPTKVTSPEIKAIKLTLLEANRIFAKSANSLEIDSIWSWFKYMLINYNNKQTPVNVSFVDNVKRHSATKGS